MFTSFSRVAEGRISDMADKKLTPERSMADFVKAYKAKKKLIERQKEDFLFRLGSQWSASKLQKLKEAGIEPVTDNRIAPNINLLTGLERQNRSDFKAFPEGEEDSLKAEIATHLFKDSIKKSDFGFKASEAFEDGAICGESNLELYLDNTDSLINADPCWKKINGSQIFPGPFKEYDYSDAPYIYKLSLELSKDELIGLFPEMEKEINKSEGGEGSRVDFKTLTGSDEVHTQKRDYSKTGDSGSELESEDESFDLLERYYKKFVMKFYLGDRQTGEIKEAKDQGEAEDFVSGYQSNIQQAQDQFAFEQQQFIDSQQPVIDQNGNASMPPPVQQPIEPPQQDPERFIVIKRSVPEIWYFAHSPGIKKPLADEKAWFYPKWKQYPIIPYFSNFSTAPIEGDDRHLLIQGIVHGVKGAQEKHNSMETLEIMYLNSSANGGWLTEADSWVDPTKVERFGSMPGVNLEYKKGSQKPERIFPMQRSQGHSDISEKSAESIKAQLGINADLLAAQEGGTDSGRAIALRQRQGLLMIQKLFDNLSRTKQIAGRFLLTQLGEIYDTETSKKVLGDAFLINNFPPLMLIDPTGAVDEMGMPKRTPMLDPETQQPMKYDKEMADLVIADVLSGDLGNYDVTVGESVASETTRMAQYNEMKELAQLAPMAFSPQMIIENSDLPSHMKNQAIKNLAQAPILPVVPPKGGGKEAVPAVA